MVSETTVIDILRASRSSDGAGGKTEVLSSVASGLRANRRFYSRQSFDRAEGGPGVRTETRMLFVLYDKPFPAVRSQDVLRDADGVEFLALYVRRYGRSLQVDARRMT